MNAQGRPPSLQELTPTSLRSANPTDRAYHQLKRGILTCQLIAGSRLDERALARKFGVAHSPVREACRRLAMEGLVIAAPGKGHGVAPITPSEIRDLCELRKIVESKTAALAAQRVRPEQAARLLVLAELSYQPGNRATYDRYLHANLAFHSQLARTAGNMRLEAVVLSVLDHLQRPLYLGLDLGLDPHEATREHMEVVDAVRRKRPSLAARLMEQQLERGEKRMFAVLGSSKHGAQAAAKPARPAAAARRR
jgi:DNA-binding GntR family transcriptional regulator